MIAAPIMAALPGIIKMLQNRGKKTSGTPSDDAAAMRSAQAGLPTVGDYARGGLLGNKSAAHPKKKMAGGSIRKFNGGSMNTMKENLMPKYKKGGDMPKGMPKEMMGMMGKMQKGNTLRRGFGGQFGMPQNTGTRPVMGAMGSKQPVNLSARPSIGGMGIDPNMARTLPMQPTPMNSNMRPPTGPPVGMGPQKFNLPPPPAAPPAAMAGMLKMQPPVGMRGMNMGANLPMNQMPNVLTDPSATGRQPAVMNRRSGGAIRKFEGGTMNSMEDNFIPSYKKGGSMPKEMMAMMGKKGKATGEMPERKKMDMGMPIGKMPDPKKMGMAKPKPSSMDQKFAKGGTARYASGGMCKGNGIAKKIRSTGVMN
jgi:hypothetical protein